MGNKLPMNLQDKKCKVVMITMFKNEATVIRRMLESTLGFCDYYVMQNNGSTDGTEEIAQQFLNEYNMPGIIYNCEEGWKGFGWNRDHLICFCQEQVNHGCDWILKMDCDEILEVDDDFDWNMLHDFNIPSFHITAVAGTTLYKRCWMWNAKYKWGFYHDPCHEIIYCKNPDLGENFLRVDLPNTIRQKGLNEGQSWSNPTKFVSDSLRLEEKMIVDGDMLSEDRSYHFWYIGKSYFDAFVCRTFPLENKHQREFARRAIWYFDQWLQHKFNSANTPQINENAYMALVFNGEAYQFLNEWDKALVVYKQAEQFAPERNEHLIGQTQCYKNLKQYGNLLETASILVSPERKNPFPKYSTFIDNEYYHDTGNRPQEIYDEAVLLHQQNVDKVDVLPFIINKKQNYKKRLFVVDNFYQNPDEIREYALTQVEYQEDLRWYKGLRSTTVFRPDGIKEAFEHIIGERIVDFNSGYNGVFQIMRSHDPQVYHYDTQKWAAMIYLTPNAPLISGTRMYESRINLTHHRDDPGSDYAFQGDFYDSTKFDITDSAANIYNRLVVMDAGCYHSAGPYFGNDMQSGRLTHLFFFD